MRVELEDYVFCGPSVVFTNILIPRSNFLKELKALLKNLGEKICVNWSKCDNHLW